MGDLRRGAPVQGGGSSAPAAPEASGKEGAGALAATDLPDHAASGLSDTVDWTKGATLAGAGTAAADGTAAAGGKKRQPVQRVGRYLILRQIGAGGMGVVFAAYDEELDRKVAVKLLRKAGDARSDLRVRILREAQAMARLSHPNVVQIYEVGEVGEAGEVGEVGEVAAISGQVFIAMEFIEGTTLSEWQRPRSWEEVLPVYLQAGQGLLAAHESGLVHRDFKPDNVLVGTEGRPRVADFGLARTQTSETGPLPPGEVAPGSAMSVDSLLVSPLTQEGVILGTPAYMSPEQHRGEPTDSRCDQFSFCAALYEGLYKTLPFAGRTLSELRQNVLAGNLGVPPPRSAVPHKVDAALRRGLATDPAQRFPSMRAMLEALAFDPKRDPGAAPRARKLFSQAMAGIMLVALVAMFPTARRGEVTAQQVLTASGLFLLVGSLVAFFLRRTLLDNEFHRSTIFCILVFTIEQLCMQGLAALTGLTPRQILPIEFVCMAGTCASLSYFLFHSGWLLQPLLLLSALWAALRPQHGGMVTAVAYPVCMAYLLFLWERAARSHRNVRLGPASR